MKKYNILIICLLTFSTLSGFSQIYVNSVATGNNDGTSWFNAYTKLQDALSDSNLSQIKEIWVAQGTYYPDEGNGYINNDFSATFNIPDSVRLYGGFVGNETMLSQRDFRNHETILSGNIDNLHDSTYNSRIVVSIIDASDQTILDGFTITGGFNHDYIHFDINGGGLYVLANSKDCSPHINNCKIINNSAENGGGLSNCSYINSNHVHAVYTNCIISGNAAFYGGGIENVAFDHIGFSNIVMPVFLDCIISGNKAYYSGGGVLNNYSNSIFVNCALVNNAAVEGAGGISNYGDNIFYNSIVWGNEKGGSNYPMHGQIYNNAGSSISFNYCDVEGSGGSSSWNTEFGTDGGHNIDLNPYFISETDTSLSPISAGDYHVIVSASPVINAGTPDTTGLNLPTFDLDGNSRILFGNIDMGPYEYIFSSISYLSSMIDIVVFPNPARDFVIIKTNAKKGTYSIFSVDGQAIQNGCFNAEINFIDTQNLCSGIYSIIIKTDDNVYIRKIVISK